MGTPSTVITEGFGSFGSVNLLITDGFDIGAAIVPHPTVITGTWCDGPGATGTWSD